MSMFQKRKKTEFVVVHSAATKAAMDIGVADIRRWHRQQGYTDIGYHWVIRRDGTLEQGRDESVVGAHVKNYNATSIGICMAGGLDARGKAENNYTAAQFATLRALLVDIAGRYKGIRLMGHRDFPGVAKDCPCFDVKAWAKEQGLG